jgi:hypothetical protein
MRGFLTPVSTLQIVIRTVNHSREAGDIKPELKNQYVISPFPWLPLMVHHSMSHYSPPMFRSFPEIADKKYDYTLKVILAFYDLGNADICFFR